MALDHSAQAYLEAPTLPSVAESVRKSWGIWAEGTLWGHSPSGTEYFNIWITGTVLQVCQLHFSPAPVSCSYSEVISTQVGRFHGRTSKGAAAASCTSRPGDQTCNAGICPHWESNQSPLGTWAHDQPLSHTSWAEHVFFIQVPTWYRAWHMSGIQQTSVE